MKVSEGTPISNEQRLRERVAISTLARAVRWRSPARAPRLSVLIFHRVHRERDPLFSSEPDAQRFERIMSWVCQCFRVLPLSEAICALKQRRLPAGAISITFDDGYADNVTVALPILQRLGLPATFFIAAGYLDGGRMFNDTIIEAVRAHVGETLDLTSLSLGRHATASWEEKRAAAEAIIGNVKHIPFQEREDIADAVAHHIGQPLPSTLMMSSPQVKHLRDAGMEIGGHTLSHPILAQTSVAQAEQEIAEGKAKLEAITGDRIRLFAYPNGKPVQDYHAAHVDLVKRLGFDGACSTAWGVADAGFDSYQVPRFTPWDAEPWKFCLRLVQNLGRAEYERV